MIIVVYLSIIENFSQETCVITFNPTAVSAPVQTSAVSLMTGGGSPAALLRIEGANIRVGVATGVANTQTGAAATADQRYEVGSQTKMMTSTIIPQVADEGKIDLDARAALYLGADTLQGIANADTATVRQLLQMTSGIASYTEVLTPEGVPAFIDGLLKNQTRNSPLWMRSTSPAASPPQGSLALTPIPTPTMRCSARSLKG